MKNIARRQNLQPSALYQRTVGGHVLYSHVVSSTPGRMIFVSGQLARDKNGTVVAPGDMKAQIHQVGHNLRVALEEAGATLQDIVRTTTYVTDIDAFFGCVDARMEYFGPGMPTSTTVEVRRLSHPDLMVEVEALAIVHDAN